jgi:hypothetical protein
VEQDRVGLDIATGQGGHIAGSISASDNGSPLVNVRVRLATVDGRVVTTIPVSAADGSYRSRALPAGQYHAITNTFNGYINKGFDGVPCLNCDPATLTPINVAVGVEASADFVLEPGGQISGTVIAADTGLPFPSPRPTVRVLDDQGTAVALAGVASNGSWLVTTGLPAGSYFVRTRNRSGYIDQLFGSVGCFWCLPPPGTPVVVSVGVTTPGINFALSPGFTMSGRATVLGTYLPAFPTQVEVYDPSGELVTNALVGGDGAWITSNGLGAGTYYLRTQSNGRYRDRLFGGSVCEAECDVTQGTPITISTAPLTDLDFELEHLPVFVDGFEGLLPTSR